MKKFSIIGIVALLILGAAYFGIKTYASGAAEEQVSIAVEQFSEYANIEYDGVEVAPIGQDLTVSNITISPKQKFGAGPDKDIKVKELTIYDLDSKTKEGEIPEFLSMKMEGMEFDIEELGRKEAREFRELGYGDKLLVDLNIDYKYDDDKKELQLKDFTISSDEVGELTINTQLSNIDLGEDMNPMALMMQVMFHGGTIEYTDHSLMERAMKKGAADERQDLAEFKNDLLKDLDKEMEKASGDFALDALKEIKEFVKNPKKISISAKPSRALNAGSFMNIREPNKAAEMLGLKIKS